MEIRRNPDGSSSVLVRGAWRNLVSGDDVDEAKIREAADTFARQSDPRSHERFFASSSFANDRNRVRRAKALETEVVNVVKGLTEPPRGNKRIRTISDESWQQFHAHPEVWESEGFHPISSYYASLSASKARPIFSGEVGVVIRTLPSGLPDHDNSYVLVLESGFSRPIGVGIGVPERRRRGEDGKNPVILDGSGAPLRGAEGVEDGHG